MRNRTKVILALIFITLPFVGRLLWFYQGWYSRPPFPEIEEDQIAPSLPEYHHPIDQPVESNGTVVIDLSHDNNLRIDDLAPLRDRLTARGITVESLVDPESSLKDYLQSAIALIVISPISSYSAEDRDAINDFVGDGGRLLLAADPTRPASTDVPRSLRSVFERVSAVPAINSIANDFGIVYFDDYLYNLVDYENNYRNVNLSISESEHDLTQNLNSVVFFAAHSLHTGGIPLIIGDGYTFSSIRSGESDLVAAAITTDDQVLALGDTTFLTAPYHTIADNDRFLSNIADWLATAPREWELIDFPYMFTGMVDLVQIGDGLLDPRLIIRSDTLQDLLHQARLSLNLSVADNERDAIFVGTFEDAELVQEYLAAAGVTVMQPDDENPDETLSTIEVDGLGPLGITGTSIFVVGRDSNRTVVIALAEDTEAAIQALDMLVSVDFSDCYLGQSVTICSTGEVPEGLDFDAEGDEADQPFGDEISAEGPPQIATPAEAEAALEAMTPALEDLANEVHDVNSQAGETYTYTIEMDTSQDVLWIYGWCTETQEQLQQNWSNISLAFTLDGEEVTLDRFAMLERSFTSTECRWYFALLTDWPPGTHQVITEVTFETAINDGLDDYPAGTHKYEYWVLVAEAGN